MKLVILGTGDMGAALATALSQRTGHEVRVRGSYQGSRSAIRLMQTLGLAEAQSGDLLAADVVFVVVPWDSVAEASELLENYRGIVVSVVVPWVNGGDPRTTPVSAAERLKALLPHAIVTCAFTTLSSSIILDPGPQPAPSALVCSDDTEAKTTVLGLATDIGLDAVDGGPLELARYVEGMGLLYVHLAYGAGYGKRVTFRIDVAK